jgi:hypothetical protein
MKPVGWCYIGALIRPYDLIASLPTTLYDQFHTTTSACSKVPWGLLVPLKDSRVCAGHWVRWVSTRDSGDLVKPFMQADN